MSFSFEKATPETWPQVHALLSEAIEMSPDHTAETVIDELIAGTSILGVYRDGEKPVMACVTRLVDTKKGRQAEVILLGGSDRGKWLSYFDDVKQAARESGAKRIVVDGRPGWAKLLKMPVKAVTMVEEL